MKCKKHPKYHGYAKPQSTCVDCWYIYFGIAEMCRNCGCQENNHCEEDEDEDK